LKDIKVTLIGLGNVGKPLCRLLAEEERRLAERCGVRFRLVGVCDSAGCAVDPEGLDPLEVLRAKEQTGSVSGLAGAGRPGMRADELIRTCGAQMLLECTPPSLPLGQPGLDHIRTALEYGMDVVTANKSPLAVAWQELFDTAERNGRQLRFSCAASAGLPTIEMGRFLGQCDELLEMAGVFNASCQFILERMAEGDTFEEGCAAARVGGFLEADPAMDVDGWDVAMKTVIQANAYFGAAVHLDEVACRGIRDITRADLLEAEAKGEKWMMVGRARKDGDRLILSAGPERLPKDHPLARANWCDKALYLKTRTQGEQIHYCLGASASGTPGSVLNDMIAIGQSR